MIEEKEAGKKAFPDQIDMVEHQRSEWKSLWRDDYLKWISGFANAEGGVLVIGRNDKGEVVGLPDARRLLVDLPNKIRDVLGILAQINLMEEEGREYLEIVVDPYPNPISCRGEYFLRTGSTLIEAWGRGIERMMEACASAGVPPPEFRDEPTGLWIEFRFPLQPGTGKPAQVEAQVEAQVSLTDLDWGVLTTCSTGERSGKELGLAAGYLSRTGNFKKGLQRLIDLELMELTIPDKPTSSRQRYRITPKGRAWVAARSGRGANR